MTHEPSPSPAKDAALNRAACKAQVRHLQTRDFEEIAGVMQRWRSDFAQLEEGPFDGQIRFADLQRVQLFDVRLNRTIMARGGHPANAFVFSPIEDTNTGSLWRGRDLRPGMMNVRAPDDELDHRTAAHYSSTNLVVDADHLRQSARSYLGMELEDLLTPSRGAVAATPASAKALARLIRLTLNDLVSSSSVDVHNSVARLVARLLDMLGASRPLPEVHMTSSRRKEIVRQLETFVIGNPGTPMTAMQLALLTGVSKRTLDHAFLDVTGLPPKTYLKVIRLNQARRELQQQRPERGIVGRVASRWGFFRSDHFAADFQQQFGELPSQSLGRRFALVGNEGRLLAGRST